MSNPVKMLAEHLSQIVEIENLCFKTPWTINMFQKDLENPIANYYVAIENNKVIAYIGFYHILDEAHITNVAVHPDYQGKGFAKEILNYSIEEMKKMGIKRATLEVNERNNRAISLYEKFGFKLGGKRQKYYEGVDAALIYWLEL